MIKDGHAYTLKREWPFRDQVILKIKGTPDTVVDGDLFSEFDEDVQEFVKKWFFDNFEESKSYHTSCPVYSSYGWKHILEKLVPEGYMSNNQAKDALLSWGFKPKDPNELNWIFRIKQKDRSRTARYKSGFYRAGASRAGYEFEKRRAEKFWRHEDLSKYNYDEDSIEWF